MSRSGQLVLELLKQRSKFPNFQTRIPIEISDDFSCCHWRVSMHVAQKYRDVSEMAKLARNRVRWVGEFELSEFERSAYNSDMTTAGMHFSLHLVIVCES